MTIEYVYSSGDREEIELTEEEYTAWSTYADTHPLLLVNYVSTLRMFLWHWRQGVDLNKMAVALGRVPAAETDGNPV